MRTRHPIAAALAALLLAGCTAAPKEERLASYDPASEPLITAFPVTQPGARLAPVPPVGPRDRSDEVIVFVVGTAVNTAELMLLCVIGSCGADLFR